MKNNLDLVRQKFLDFYAKHNHAVIPSASLLPENDATTLFTSSGMQPLLSYFMGTPHPAGKRVCDSQKCFRSVDIDEVGDNRHTTFFEMLGNWSFGDYFKQKQLGWVFEFFTKELSIDPQRLYVTVFAGNSKLGINRDDDSISLWQALFASREIKAEVGERIFVYNEHKNWWSRSGTPKQMPAGEPGGADSEIFYDFGAELKLHENSPWANQPCHPNCDCGRFIEIGNSVFMEFVKTKAGKFESLPSKNVDYGGGLERALMAMENKEDVFQTSAFMPLISQLEADCGLTYLKSTKEQKRAFRIIADHLRSSVMLLNDGVIPSNKEQGYVLRRLLRRCLVQARELNLPGNHLINLLAPLARLYHLPYPELTANQDQIAAAITTEIKRFSQTLEKGLKEIAKHPQIDGEIAFFLYESYGFPWELTQEIVSKKGATIDYDEFLQAKKKHQQASKKGESAKFRGGLADSDEVTVKYHTATHLLLAALRKNLGEEIMQKGSNITKERARFDFNFTRALTDSEITKLTKQINDWISQDLPVEVTTHPKEEALQLVGGSAFSDRYPDEVTVYTIGDASKEICVGPHVRRTGELASVTLAKEGSAGAGVRRLYLYFS